MQNEGGENGKNNNVYLEDELLKKVFMHPQNIMSEITEKLEILFAEYQINMRNRRIYDLSDINRLDQIGHSQIVKKSPSRKQISNLITRIEPVQHGQNSLKIFRVKDIPHSFSRVKGNDKHQFANEIKDIQTEESPKFRAMSQSVKLTKEKSYNSNESSQPGKAKLFKLKKEFSYRSIGKASNSNSNNNEEELLNS